MISSGIRLKTPDDIKRIEEAGAICADVFRYLDSLSMEGMSTWELDSLVDGIINRTGARSAFKTLHGYNYSSCISINDEVAHGIPSKKRYILGGDVVKVDIGVVQKGYFADACRTFTVSSVSPEGLLLAQTVKKAFRKALSVIMPGQFLESIGNAIDEEICRTEFRVIASLTGHGVGFALHEAPKVPHYKNSGHRIFLQEGLVLAVEPAITSGNGDIVKDRNNFTLKTSDGACAVQYEETVAVTGHGPLVLTS